MRGFAGDLSVASVAENLFQRHPTVDILVNNLGIFEVRPFEEIADADWQRFFDVNVLSGARLARLYLPSMRKRNWGRGPTRSRGVGDFVAAMAAKSGQSA